MKTKPSRIRPNRQILDEASVWFVDFRVDDVDDAAREEFNTWLRRSPEHIQAYLEIASTYAELPVMDPEGRLDVAALIAHARGSADVNVIPIVTPAPNASKGRHHSRLAIAASVVIAALGALGWWQFERDTYSTAVGEQRSITLTDGSTVELSARSKVQVRYTENERDIDLLEGQALFQVEKDANRPFVVRSNGTRVRAVGTQFDVHRKKRGTTVTVLEGTVAVISPLSLAGQHTASAPRSSADQGDDARNDPGLRDRRSPEVESKPGDARREAAGRQHEVILSAGQQITVTAVAIEAPKTADLVAATAWTQRRLVFEHTPLVEVAEEFNRYSTRVLIVDTRGLEDFHISGTYASNNPDSLLRFLRAQPRLRITETDREINVASE